VRPSLSCPCSSTTTARGAFGLKILHTSNSPLCMRVYDSVNSNSILAGEQFGFRKNLSTVKALFSFTEELSGALNNKMHVGGTSCDLTKASDCVNHELLLSKLNNKYSWSVV
jgi:hypothetical protein